jgi:hypothetical protein
MQKVESINNTLTENLNKLHELQKKKNLSEHEKGMLNYYHGIVKALRWVKTSVGSL